MSNQDSTLYKLFINGKDQSLSLDEVAHLVKSKHIKSDTRVYSLEAAQWISYGDYTELHHEINRYQEEAKNKQLTACHKCSHKCSNRATSCPKCGAQLANIKQCIVCEQYIPNTSVSCPECGDPEPFGNDLSVPAEAAPKHTELQSPISDVRPSIPIPFQYRYAWLIAGATALIALVVSMFFSDLSEPLKHGEIRLIPIWISTAIFLAVGVGLDNCKKNIQAQVED